MAAVIQVSVSNGAGETPTDGVGGIDFISADNATNSIGNRQTYPITVGTNSYEKWIRLKIATPAQNYTRNFLIWGDGDVTTSTTLMFTANYVTYATPTASTSAVADTDFTGYTAGTYAATWDAATYWATNTGSYTRYAVFQLQVGSDRAAGDWQQETISYSYEEA